MHSHEFVNDIGDNRRWSYFVVAAVALLIALVLSSGTSQAATLVEGTKVTDAATCDRITKKANINTCKICVAGGKVWTTGAGSTATACSAN